jgi:hypothetical protein
MAENNGKPKSGFTLDWLVRGVLTKTGDTLDRLTGRSWKPSSSLATSELIERLKSLLDSEARDEGTRGVFVPHNIELKMQWDKFSTDSEETLRALETELLAAAVDHINDRRYYTYAPLTVEIKPDYFTSGVVLLVNFEKFSDDQREAVVNVAVPGEVVAHSAPVEIPERPVDILFAATFEVDGEHRQKKLIFKPRERLSVGRTRENDLAINHVSISKIHASLAINANGELIASDTGSKNGTFVNGQRIAYGKTAVIENDTAVTFGAVEVTFNRVLADVTQDEQFGTQKSVVEEGGHSNLPFINTRIEYLKSIPTESEDADSFVDSPMPSEASKD